MSLDRDEWFYDYLWYPRQGKGYACEVSKYQIPHVIWYIIILYMKI